MSSQTVSDLSRALDLFYPSISTQFTFVHFVQLIALDQRVPALVATSEHHKIEVKKERNSKGSTAK